MASFVNRSSDWLRWIVPEEFNDHMKGIAEIYHDKISNHGC